MAHFSFVLPSQSDSLSSHNLTRGHQVLPAVKTQNNKQFACFISPSTCIGSDRYHAALSSVSYLQQPGPYLGFLLRNSRRSRPDIISSLEVEKERMNQKRVLQPSLFKCPPTLHTHVRWWCYLINNRGFRAIAITTHNLKISGLHLWELVILIYFEEKIVVYLLR